MSQGAFQTNCVVVVLSLSSRCSLISLIPPPPSQRSVVASPDGEVIHLVGTTSEGRLQGLALQRKTGRLISTGAVTPATPLVGPLVIVAPHPAGSEPLLVAACTAGCAQLGSMLLAHLTSSEEAGGSAKLAYTALTAGPAALLASSVPGGDSSLVLRGLAGGLLALETPGTGRATAVVAHAGQGSSPAWRLVASWAQGDAVVDAALLPSAEAASHASQTLVLGAVRPSDGPAGAQLQMTVTDVASGSAQATELLGDWAPANHGGLPARVFLGTYTRRDGGRGFRVLLAGMDHSVALAQQGRLAWLREESLAQVIASVFVEPPAAVAAAGTKTAAVSAPVATSAAESNATAALGALPPSPPDWPHVPHVPRDEHGFHRVVVALTAAGKLVAMRSSDGRIVWTRLLASPGSAPPTALLLWRDGSSPLVMVVTPQGGSSTRLEWLDAHSGVTGGSDVVAVAATRVMATTAQDGASRRVLLLWDAGSRAVGVYPPDQAAAALASRPTLVQHTATGLHGFTLVASADAAQLLAVPCWTLALPQPQVLAMAQREAGEDTVFSSVRVTGDRDQQHKFVSHNTLLVAVPGGGGGGGDSSPSAVEVVVLDTVTGRILYRVRHASALGPVHAVATDNAFVYTYRSSLGLRTEVSVLELFVDPTRVKPPTLASVILSALAPASAPAHGPTRQAHPEGGVSSSLAPPPLRVLGQSYTLSGHVAALGVARTRRGLAARQVLVASPSGRLVAMDRRFVDPRRPTKPTASDREEGLVPYAEALPLLPGAHITGAARLARVRHVSSAPASLESASHVLACGLDLFYARTAPSRTFDTLGDEFSRPLLVATLAALTVAAAAAATAANRDSVARQWL